MNSFNDSQKKKDNEGLARQKGKSYRRRPAAMALWGNRRDWSPRVQGKGRERPRKR